MTKLIVQPVLFENADWLIANKPTGISTHANHEGALGLAEWLKLHHERELFICSRLDKGTSGVLLFAKNTAASTEKC